MQGKYLDEKISIDEAIKRLQSNETQWTHFRDRMIADTDRRDRGLFASKIPALAAAIRANTSLHTVEIYDDIFHPKAFSEALGAALKDHPGLQSLSIHDFSFPYNDPSSSGLLTALTGAAPIKNLYISRSPMCEYAQFLPAFGAVINHKHTLKSITLEGRNSDRVRIALDIIQNFVTALCHAKALEALDISFLNFGLSCPKKSWACVAEHLSSIKSLKQLKLREVGLRYKGVEALTSILKANPELTDLHLYSDDPLDSLDRDRLCTLMPSLKSSRNLQQLLLKFMDEEAMQYFVDQCRNDAHPVTIPVLHLNCDWTRQISADNIQKLVYGNIYLKELYVHLRGPDGDQKIAALTPLLSNPHKCHLEKVRFYGGKPERLLKIAQENLFIEILTSEQAEEKVSPDLRDLRLQQKFNAKNIIIRNQQYWLMQLIDIVNMNTSLPKGKILPLDLIVKIMIMLHGGTNVLGMDIPLCTKLILSNFNTRRQLINAGEYKPTPGETPQINKWWKQTIEVKEGDPQTTRSIQLLAPNYFNYRFRHFRQLPSYESPQEIKEIPPTPKSSCSVM